jgi:membrane associated rhomboid family serine protease
VFVWEILLPEAAAVRVFAGYGLVPARILGPAHTGGLLPPGAGLSTLLTSMFLYAGWLHVIMNLWTLWIFGDNVEDRMGPGRFLSFYLASGVAAGLVHLLSNPASTVPTVGASGAIAGALGAYFILFPRARVLTVMPLFFWPFFVEVPAVLFMAIWFGSQLLSGVAAVAGGGEQAGGVAWWAHVGGFVAGLLLCPLFVRRSRR